MHRLSSSFVSKVVPYGLVQGNCECRGVVKHGVSELLFGAVEENRVGIINILYDI